MVSAVLFEPFPVTDKIFFLWFKSLLVLHKVLLDFCLQKSSISTSCYARSFVGYTQICLRFPYLDKYSSINYYLNKQKTESYNQSKGDSSVLHWASCSAHKNHVIRQISARIPRTRYCFSINRPCKQVQCSLALERALWPLFFIAYFLGRN